MIIAESQSERNGMSTQERMFHQRPIPIGKSTRKRGKYTEDDDDEEEEKEEEREWEGEIPKELRNQLVEPPMILRAFPSGRDVDRVNKWTSHTQRKKSLHVPKLGPLFFL